MDTKSWTGTWTSSIITTVGRWINVTEFMHRRQLHEFLKSSTHLNLKIDGADTTGERNNLWTGTWTAGTGNMDRNMNSRDRQHGQEHGQQGQARCTILYEVI